MILRDLNKNFKHVKEDVKIYNLNIKHPTIQKQNRNRNYWRG